MGEYFTCVLLDNNELKCFGQNWDGQLGKIYSVYSAIGDEPNEMGDYLSPVDLGTNRTAKKIACGSSHTCVLLDNNEMKCFGINK